MILLTIRAEAEVRKEEMNTMTDKRMKMEEEARKMMKEIQNLKIREDRVKEAATKSKAAREKAKKEDEEWWAQALSFEESSQRKEQEERAAAENAATQLDNIEAAIASIDADDPANEAILLRANESLEFAQQTVEVRADTATQLADTDAYAETLGEQATAASEAAEAASEVAAEAAATAEAIAGICLSFLSCTRSFSNLSIISNLFKKSVDN